ncbi:aromatic ring-opening dioxygenase LigA [Ornithinimicrobium sp. CNJ-824]|uniref:aromatic ring-opening dioxygenase LigA n=1 Tax=Ornithinimicrobium sp. CNJ-824 TaxID=1904966 RepID=UPI00095FE838|nr:aromatic ring-opening dioxygenase LigA [Ornithinimicrobium sp. CNJ-824]OLT23086.1 aromatic ring-opening dioxygenase LigA [Ornithinimicrobium sp. CNJ-824]
MRTSRTMGTILMVLGLIFIIAGGATYVMVSQELSRANVTVAEDADFLAGDHVDGPFSAYSQAQIIDKHALDSTGGKTYAELDREDPLRDVAMNASFLRASLFTSVVSFGVAVMAMGVGLAFILAGVGLRAVGAVAVPAARTRAEV